jgi:lysophospholipase L1-like esterase
MRGEEFPKIKPPGEIRIMCLGGSTTAGEEVGESQTYPAQLQTILRSDIPGNNIRVINAGVPSYDVPRSWTYYGLRLYEFAPDFVLIYHGFNDLLANAAGDVGVLPSLNYSGMPLSPFVFEGDARRGGFLGSLFTPIRSIIAHSDLLTLLYYGWQTGTSRWRSSVSAPSQRGIEAYLACYRALVRDIQATGATPVIATFAISYPGNFSASDEKKIAASLRMGSLPPEVGKQIIDMQNQSVVRMSRELGLPLCDLAAAVPQDRSHFVDSCHLTAEGNHTVAAALARTIEPLVKSFIGTRLVPKRSSAGAGHSVGG